MLRYGESSRSIQERSQEHQADFRKEKEKSHMWKHRMIHHQGEDIKFVMRAVSYHKTALSRQTAEAVRIRRRGGEGAILNSRGEFNRCFIPRLTIMEEDKLKEISNLKKEQDIETEKAISKNQEAWEQKRVKERARNIHLDLDRTGRQHQRKS